jgi:hypothetical protein
VYYCCKEHQALSWKKHQPDCNPDPDYRSNSGRISTYAPLQKGAAVGTYNLAHSKHSRLSDQLDKVDQFQTSQRNMNQLNSQAYNQPGNMGNNNNSNGFGSVSNYSNPSVYASGSMSARASTQRRAGPGTSWSNSPNNSASGVTSRNGAQSSDLYDTFMKDQLAALSGADSPHSQSFNHHPGPIRQKKDGIFGRRFMTVRDENINNYNFTSMFYFYIFVLFFCFFYDIELCIQLIHFAFVVDFISQYLSHCIR